MKSPRKKISRWLGSLPALLVGALWILLIQAWPSRMPAAASARQPSAMQVRYLQEPPGGQGTGLMPLIFVQPPPRERDLLAEESPDSIRLFPGVGAVHVLERAGEPLPPLPQDDGVADGITNPAAFRLAEPEDRLFRAAGARERAILVEPSPQLQSRGFSLPPLDVAELGNSNAAWQVSLVVEGGEDGRVENVFVEGGTTNRDFSLALVRKVALEAKLTPGAPCRGRLVVSYGEE